MSSNAVIYANIMDIFGVQRLPKYILIGFEAFFGLEHKKLNYIGVFILHFVVKRVWHTDRLLLCFMGLKSLSISTTAYMAFDFSVWGENMEITGFCKLAMVFAMKNHAFYRGLAIM